MKKKIMLKINFMKANEVIFSSDVILYKTVKLLNQLVFDIELDCHFNITC